MNYLETGLPLSDFVRRKSDFSPPRFIPLCSLGRKYRGLESLTRREVGVLVNRLSEPKKSSAAEDSNLDITTVRRKATPGTGRFVGQKKMSSFEIEKMVDRLYSRRSTKDYSFVDETVEADDIMNMTNQNDSDDSENEAEENKDVKERQNSILREDTNDMVAIEHNRKNSVKFKREDTDFNEQKSPVKNRNLPEVGESNALPSISKTKPKTSVTFQRAKSVTDHKKNSGENQQVTDKINSERSFSKPEMRRSYSSPVHRSQMSPTQKSHPSLSPRAHPQTSSFQSRSDVYKSEQTEDKSKSFLAQAVAPKSHGAELTRPTSSNFFLLLETPEEAKASKFESSVGRTEKTIEKGSGESPDASVKSAPVSKKLEPTGQKGGKPPRFTAAPCDELLIDRVATYNRTTKLRCK